MNLNNDKEPLNNKIICVLKGVKKIGRLFICLMLKSMSRDLLAP